jgi:hypothetical protein
MQPESLPDMHGGSFDMLLGRKAGLIATAGILILAALPSDGTGVPLCPFRYLTGLPCPGCGLTRGLSSLLQLQFAHAYDYHPLVFVLLPAAVLIAMQALLPDSALYSLRVWAKDHDAGLRSVAIASMISFVIFGITRLGIYWALGLRAI